jgi:hypothetical protein
MTLGQVAQDVQHDEKQPSQNAASALAPIGVACLLVDTAPGPSMHYSCQPANRWHTSSWPGGPHTGASCHAPVWHPGQRPPHGHMSQHGSWPLTFVPLQGPVTKLHEMCQLLHPPTDHTHGEQLSTAVNFRGVAIPCGQPQVPGSPQPGVSPPPNMGRHGAHGMHCHEMSGQGIQHGDSMLGSCPIWDASCTWGRVCHPTWRTTWDEVH